MFAGTMLKILYGLDVQKEEGELIDKLHDTVSCTTSVMIGKHAVDVFPALRHLPAWVPGAGFQRVFAECKAAVAYAKEMPFATMKAFLVRERYYYKSASILTNLPRAPANLEAPRPRSPSCCLE